jgi:diguanylate cyclase (GGDEF)-like protein
MLFPRADKSKAMDMAGRILIEMRHTTFEGDRNLPSASLTVSIGVASYPEDGTTAEELLSRADEALYAAKKAGKNTAMISGDF